MRVNRPSGQPAPGGVDSTSEAVETEEVGAAGDLEAAAEVEAEPVQVTARTMAEPKLVLTRDLGEALEAGQISVEGALARVVDRMLDRQLGEGAPEGLRGRLEATLNELLETDPVLSARVARLSE